MEMRKSHAIWVEVAWRSGTWWVGRHGERVERPEAPGAVPTRSSEDTVSGFCGTLVINL